MWEIQYRLHLVLDQGGDFLSSTHEVDFDCYGRIRCLTEILLSTYLVWLWSLFASWGKSVQNIESLVKHNSFTLVQDSCS